MHTARTLTQTSSSSSSISSPSALCLHLRYLLRIHTAGGQARVDQDLCEPAVLSLHSADAVHRRRSTFVEAKSSSLDLIPSPKSLRRCIRKLTPSL